MKIVGCDLHTRYQQIAMLDDETGELIERRLEHSNGEAKDFYAKLRGPVRVGIEATGHTRWFERLLAELSYELWVGDAARIRAADVRKQKTDARDAALLLELLLSGRFPRLWRPSREDRDLRQLLWHRQKLVWMRNAVGNQLHALAMGEGICRKKQLFSKKGRAELEALNLDPWASRRRQELLHMLDQTDASLKQFDHAVNEQASGNELAVRLMTHPGVGPVTSLAFVLIVGPVTRFQRSKQLVSYLGLNPQEHSSGGRQKLGAISKQGNPMLRGLLVEAGHTAARLDPELRQDYQRLRLRRGGSVAKVAIARKLAVRMYWMLRREINYTQLVRTQGSSRATLVQP
ncbi:MAG TPA: IS110 family transposase [Candidatus Acidoferrales bacterium]|nr:IS110 family transposase [Candidatus Acidoferrales bacterium]